MGRVQRQQRAPAREPVWGGQEVGGQTAPTIGTDTLRLESWVRHVIWETLKQNEKVSALQRIKSEICIGVPCEDKWTEGILDSVSLGEVRLFHGNQLIRALSKYSCIMATCMGQRFFFVKLILRSYPLIPFVTTSQVICSLANPTLVR